MKLTNEHQINMRLTNDLQLVKESEHLSSVRSLKRITYGLSFFFEIYCDELPEVQYENALFSVWERLLEAEASWYENTARPTPAHRKPQPNIRSNDQGGHLTSSPNGWSITAATRWTMIWSQKLNYNANRLIARSDLSRCSPYLMRMPAGAC